MRPRPLTLASLGLAYLFLLPEIGWGDLPVAAGVALAISLLAPPPVKEVPTRSPAPGVLLRAGLRLAGQVLADVAGGTWRVAGMSTGLVDRPVPGLVEVPFGDRSPRGAAVHGLLLTLSPGTLLVDIDEDRRILLFHVAGVEGAAFERTAARLYATQRLFLP